MDKIWLESYVEGVPENLPPPAYKSLRELVEHCFVRYADRPAYTNMGTTLTYRDLDKRSMQFACYLQNTLGLVNSNHPDPFNETTERALHAVGTAPVQAIMPTLVITPTGVGMRLEDDD